MRFCLLLAVLLISYGLYAQQDNVSLRIIHKVDSVLDKKQAGIDSTQHKILQILQIKIVSDTSKALQKLRQEKSALQQKVDSLTKIGQPSALWQQKLDSLNSIKPLRTLDSLNQQLSLLQQKIQDSVSKVESAIDKQVQTINTFAANQVPLELTTTAPNLPTTASLPTTIQSVDANIPQVSTGIENLKPDLELPKEMQQGKEQLGKIGELSSSVDAYQKDIQQIKEGGLRQSTELSSLAEKQVGSIEEVSALNDELGKNNLPVKGLDEESAKAMLKEQAQEEIVQFAKDHFASKQDALMSGMQKLGDLKTTYESLDSINVPKRNPNTMKGKPLSERLTLGLTIQIQKWEYWLLDLNPSLAYRITGRWGAGLGWNQRIGLTKELNRVEQEKIYGPRMFTEFLWAKGFSLRLEAEKMFGVSVPSFSTPKSADEQRVWMTTAFAGIKKEYKISNQLRGNIQILYMIYDDHHISPYAIKINTRLGLEYSFNRGR